MKFPLDIASEFPIALQKRHSCTRRAFFRIFSPVLGKRVPMGDWKRSGYPSRRPLKNPFQFPIFPYRMIWFPLGTGFVPVFSTYDPFMQKIELTDGQVLAPKALRRSAKDGKKRDRVKTILFQI
jgi:hypothetical protein